MSGTAIQLSIDFAAITALFAAAAQAGRDTLFEHETYELLQRSGAETPPRTNFLAKGSRPSDEELLAMPGAKVVLKIVSPTIVHKTEVGGVKVVEKARRRSARPGGACSTRCRKTTPPDRARSPHAPERSAGSRADRHWWQAISRDIEGVLLVQFMPPDSEAFGNEMIVGIRNTREFGMIISAGLGGTDTELYAERFRKGQAIVAASTRHDRRTDFFELFRQTISYRKLAGLTRGQRRIVTDEQIIECFLADRGHGQLLFAGQPPGPLRHRGTGDQPLCLHRFSHGAPRRHVPLLRPARRRWPGRRQDPQPAAPATIGIIGVSTSRAQFRAGDPRQHPGRRLCPGKDPHDAPGWRALRRALRPRSGRPADCKLDLLVVAVASAQVPDLVDEVCALTRPSR
jgi:hypothetical protein